MSKARGLDGGSVAAAVVRSCSAFARGPPTVKGRLMLNLYEILQNAQGGQAVDNLANQFNISSEQANAVLKAVLPDMSAAFLQQSGQPTGFSSMLGALADPQHAASFADAGAAASRDAMQKGADLLAHLFGGQEQNAVVTQNAAAFAGLPPALIQQMLPVIASMVMGGLGKAMANQGLGGIFAQLANAASQGGLGTILGSLLGGGQASPQAGPAGGSQAGADSLAGMFGTIFGSFFGQHSGMSPQAGAPNASAAPGPSPSAGFDPAAIQHAIEAWTKMLQPGTPPSQNAAANGLQDDIDAIFKKKG